VAVPVRRLSFGEPVSPHILPRNPSIHTAFQQNLWKKPPKSIAAISKSTEKHRICVYELILMTHLSRSPFLWAFRDKVKTPV
jgi:hypothetical protein